MQAWTQADDYYSFVPSPDAIARARQQLLEADCIRSDDGARAALRMAHELLNYRHRAMARCLYHQVARYCCEHTSRRNQNCLISALVQIAKMITVDARSGAATAEDQAAALAVLEWAGAGAVDAEAQLWLEHVNNMRNNNYDNDVNEEEEEE